MVQRIKNEIIFHDLDKITEYFNQKIDEFFGINLPITYYNYKTITILPKFRINGQLNLPLKREINKSLELRLYIREDIFFAREKLGLLLMHEFYFILFSDKFDENIASDVAFAIIWDEIKDKSTKKWLFTIWHSMHPPFRVTPNLVYYLAGYVKVISENEKGKYRNLFLLKYFEIDTEKLSPVFPYQVAIPTLADFSKNDLKVMRAIINNNTIRQKVLILNTKLGKTTISKSVNRLLHSFILRERVNYYPTALGWVSIFGLIHIDRMNSELIYHFKYPWTRLITVFKGFSDFIYLNFYIPDTNYAKEQFGKWLNQSFSDNLTDGLLIKVLSEPIFGIEKEKYRLNIQNPELYDKSKEKWLLGKINKFKIATPEKHYGEIKWNKLKRKIALEMMKKPYTKNDIFKVLGGNRNKLIEIINQIEESKIVQLQYVMPFFDDLISVLVIYRGMLYNDFIQNIASIVPLSINYVFEQTRGSSFKNDSNLIGLSFLSIPNMYIKQIQSQVLDLDSHAQFGLFPLNISTAVNFDIKPTHSGWKFIKIPRITFVM